MRFEVETHVEARIATRNQSGFHHRRQNDMQEELHALEAQYRSLQTLVGELLLTNQKLRLEVTQLKQEREPSAQATHPQPHPDR
jgi:regulator of replication initiation timing